MQVHYNSYNKYAVSLYMSHCQKDRKFETLSVLTDPEIMRSNIKEI